MAKNLLNWKYWYYVNVYHVDPNHMLYFQVNPNPPNRTKLQRRSDLCWGQQQRFYFFRILSVWSCFIESIWSSTFFSAFCHSSKFFLLSFKSRFSKLLRKHRFFGVNPPQHLGYPALLLTVPGGLIFFFLFVVLVLVQFDIGWNNLLDGEKNILQEEDWKEENEPYSLHICI